MELPRASPAEVGLDGEVLSGLVPQFEAWTAAKLHSALILRHGKLAFEHYFKADDWAWATLLGEVAFDADTRHDMRSVTKSVTSLLFGIARDRGLIGCLDTPALDYFPELADLRTAHTSAITLRHLLTMSAGLAWDEALPYSDRRNSERQMIDAPDQLRYIFSRPGVRPPGATWQYNGGCTAALAHVVARAAGRPFEEFAEEALFGPLGIQDAEWIRCYADGTVNACSGLRLTPRDMAKLGLVALNRGAGLVSPGWIEESLTPWQNADGLWFYGYQWWLGRSLVRRREVRWAQAMGHGGQRIFVVPELDMVVVVTAGLYHDGPFQAVPGEVVLRRYALSSAIPA
ncbi:serine hydrolase domain-containing protein [Roseococcus sp. YIM B11640]|uniref:serine hydrolase domain-containing protein n=1 Tax=Roseococcus sp. YIM B11640 TaxID=3133973 RepID=UPI003C7B007F